MLEHTFYKHGGGLFGKAKQKRIVRVYKHGYLAYFDGNKKEPKGYFRLGHDTQVELENDYFLKIKVEKDLQGDKVKSDREFLFEEPKKEKYIVLEWIDRMQKI